MKKTVIINMDIQKLPEGGYVATSADVQGLVAQGKSFEEVVDIAHDVAQVLLRAQKPKPPQKTERIFYPMHIIV